MAGIDFMAFANGMMQADRLNKEDDTYWRKQATDDIAAKNLERDQAFKEQEQGYKLNTFEDFQQNKEAGLLSAQAYDAYSQKAKAMGVSMHQVIMDSPAFELPNATPVMQARFNQKLNDAIQTNIIAPLRQNRDFESANRLTGRLGLPGQTAENPMLSFGDPEKEAAFIASKMPGAPATAEGVYSIGGESFTRAEAFLLANSNPSSAIAAIVAKQNARLAGATTQTQQTQLQASGAEAIARTRYTDLAAQARAGIPIGQIYPPDQEAYAKILSSMPPVAGASASGANPNSIAAMTSAPALPVTPAMPVRQSNVPVAAMPVRQSNVPVAAMPVPSLQQARENINATTADLIAMSKEPQYFTPDKIAAARAVLAKQEQVLKLVQSANVASFKAGMSTPPKTQPSYVDVLNSRYK